MSLPPTTMSTLSSSATTIPGGPNEPPIIYLFHLLLQASSILYAALSLTTRALTSTFRFILTPIVVVSSPILYILSPFLLFLRVTIQVFILTPYRVTVYLLDELYPVYAFVGTAVICATLVGLGARLAIWGVNWMLFDPDSESGPQTDQKDTHDSGSVRRKSSRRVKLKEADGGIVLDSEKVGVIYY